MLVGVSGCFFFFFFLILLHSKNFSFQQVKNWILLSYKSPGSVPVRRRSSLIDQFKG